MNLLPFKIAYKFLKSDKAQTVLIVLGIAIGISVQIYVGSLIGSLQVGLVEDTIGSTSHITISSTNDTGTISDWEPTVAELDGYSKIINVNPVISQGGYVVASNNRTKPVTLRGMELSRADGIYGISNSIIEGRPYQDDGEILLGEGLCEVLSLSVGDAVTISIPSGSSYEMNLTGIFDLGTSGQNMRWCLSTISSIQELLGQEGRITSVEMQVRDVFEASSIKKGVEERTTMDMVGITSWEEENEDLLNALSAQSTSSLMIQVFIVISVVIAIASVLAITVIQKRKQIGILKAMGINDRDASLVFLTEGFLLGTIGTVLGVFLGIFLFYAFVQLVRNPDGSQIVPLVFDYGFIAISAVIAVISATVASFIPARKSSKLDPIEVIRDG